MHPPDPDAEFSERQQLWAEAASELTDSLHPPFRLGEPLRRIASGAGRLVRARLAAVVRSSDEGYDVPAAVADEGTDLSRLLDGVHPSIRESQRTGEPFELPQGERGTLVGVPLAPELGFEGVVVVVVERGQGSLSPEDRELLTSFVTHGSLVLDRAALLAEGHEEVMAADRDRIARDLHDIVVQRLLATGLSLKMAGHGASDVVQARLGDAVEALDLTIRDIRATIFELEHGREVSLRNGLTALAREYEPLLGFAPSVRTWGPLNTLVRSELGDEALPVLREALSNCARHAGATRCEIEVRVADGWLTVQVGDDGRGLDGERHESGLRNARHRAERLGGSLTLASADPGTVLEWRVPLGA